MEAEKKRRTPRGWNLSTLKAVRKRIGLILRDFHADPAADCTRTRTIFYGLQIVADCLKTEKQNEIEARLAALEERLGTK